MPRPEALGALGAVPGWPGAEVLPSQPMEAQMRSVLAAYAANGGKTKEVVLEGIAHRSRVRQRVQEVAARRPQHVELAPSGRFDHLGGRPATLGTDREAVGRLQCSRGRSVDGHATRQRRGIRAHLGAALHPRVSPDGISPAPGRPTLPRASARSMMARTLSTPHTCWVMPIDHTNTAPDTTHTTTIPAGLDFRTAAMFTGLIAENSDLTFRSQNDTVISHRWIHPGSGSWVRVDLNGDHATVGQAGPRRLWDELTPILDTWQAAGRPDIGRFGLTVHRDGRHVLWLDSPDHMITQLP